MLPAVGFGQAAAFRHTMDTLRRQNVFTVKQELPVGEFPSKVSQQPLPKPNAEASELQIINYGSISGSGTKVMLRDGAEITIRGYRCLAENIDGDRETEIFTLSGEVRIIGEDSTVVGESITLDAKRQTFVANYGKALIRPNLLNGKITDDVFLSGKTVSGNRERLKGEYCQFTTCDAKVPHFHFDADEADVEPGKQAILRRVKINILGRNVITLPILWIPLGDRSFKYLPQVGQSPDEGYYIKNNYGFPMNGEDRGIVRADYMSKLGVGLGFGYLYRNQNMNGIARFYAVTGKSNTVTISNQHEQRLSFGKLTVDNDIQRNNYLTAPGSSLSSTRARLTFNQGPTVNFSSQRQESNAFSNYNQTLSLSDSRRFGRISTNLDVSYSKSGGTSGTSREAVDVRFNGSQDGAKGTTSLDYQRTIPIGTVTNFFSSSDRTPVLSFRSDSTKLLGSKASKTLPFRTEFSVGEFLDSISKQRISRGVFDINFNRATRDQGPWRWDFSGGYKQNLYSDDTALYRLNFGNGVTYSLAKKLSVNMRHSYNRPFGYSPLVMDRSGTSNFLSLDVMYQKNSRSSFGLQTGYDLVREGQGQVAWQQVGIRSEYKVDQAFSLRTLSTYDTFSQVWSSMRVDATWQADSFVAALGARFDGPQHKWANVNAY
ncbi:MAG TPA: hypothetical protein VK171_08125, partial [Fimbriimonas sp.]|nr:hypothetical protein [Fimbriimonas sp.]